VERSAPREIRMFVSYSHLDQEWFVKLLPLLTFDGLISPVSAWHDNELKAGDRWDEEIRKELNRMDAFVCLVSNHFLASNYITNVEMKIAVAREKTRKTIIVPVLICDMDERDVQYLKRFNPLPAWGRSWRSYELHGGHTMDAHKPIRTGLLDVVEKITACRTGGFPVSGSH
jgi:TIR domain-containing protein